MDRPEAGADGPRELRLIDLRPGLFPVIVTGRVVRAERRTVTRSSDGKVSPVLVGWLADGSATVRFTWWDPPEEAVGAGDGLRAGPVTIREYRGRIELAFGRRTRVEPVSDLELPRLRLDASPRREVGSLRPGEDDLRIDVRIDRLEVREKELRGALRKIFLGTLSDATGTCPFVAWVDLGLAEGGEFRLVGASVRSYRERTEVVLDDRVQVETLRAAATPIPSRASSAAAATIRRDPPAVAAPPDPPLPNAAAWVDLVRELSEASPDGYAERGAIEEAAGRLPDLPDAPADMLAELVRRGLLVEPLAGLFRLPGRRVGD